MKTLKIYEADDKMISLIKDNYSVLQSLGAFGISLGFGDKTVAETCQLPSIRRKLHESISQNDAMGKPASCRFTLLPDSPSTLSSTDLSIFPT